MMIDDRYWRDISNGDGLEFEFAPPGSLTGKRTKAVQAAMVSSLEAPDCEANSEAPGWLQLARRLPDGLRSALIAELRAGNQLVGIGSSSWPSKGSIGATMGERFTVARKSPPAGVVWAGHNRMPHSWREDLSQEVGGVVYLMMT